MLLRGSIFLFFGFCLSVSGVSGQGHVHGEGEPCGFDALLEANPEAARNFEENMARALLHKRTRDKHLRETLGEAYELLQEPVYTLPIVLHVLHRGGEAVGGETNIEKNYLEKMIVELNEDFSATQPDRLILPEFQSVDGGDIGVRFSLARRDPEGLPTDGIIRVPLGDEADFSENLDSLLQVSPPWDQLRYINVWIAPQDAIGLRLGAAYVPYSGYIDVLQRGFSNTFARGTTWGGVPAGDGIILSNTAVGGGSSFAHDARPKTLAHEAGHYLGLFHPWGRTAARSLTQCEVDDGCGDTPRIGMPTRVMSNASCLAPPSCIKGTELQFPMAQNYMDYSPSRCRHMFSLCQREHMRTVLESTDWRRSLWENNDALRSVDEALRQIENNIGFTSANSAYNGCPAQVSFEGIEIANYGGNLIESIVVQFFIGDTAHGPERAIDFSPALESTSRITIFEEENGVHIPIPEDMYDGEVSLRIVNVNDAEDAEDDYGRNTYTITVNRGRVENKLHSLEFSEDGTEGVNWAYASEYENAFSIATGSKGNKLLRIHRTAEYSTEGHQLIMFTSPYMRVSEIISEGGEDYKLGLGLRFRYSYVSNDFSEGDRLGIALLDCEDSFLLYRPTDLDGATSHYPEGGEVPHDRTFRELHFPLPLEGGRITDKDSEDQFQLSDSVRVVLFAWNGGGNDLFVEDLAFTRTLSSDIPSVDLGIGRLAYDPYVCENDGVLPFISHIVNYSNYGKEPAFVRHYIREEARDIDITPYETFGEYGTVVPAIVLSRNTHYLIYRGAGTDYNDLPLFATEGFNRYFFDVRDNRADIDTNPDNNSVRYSVYYTKKDPEPLSRAGIPETFSSYNLVWVSDFVGEGGGSGWVRNRQGSYMELRFSDAVTQKDAYYRLISRRFDFSDVTGGEFTFRLAYSGTDTQNDVLRVYAVRGCGVSAGVLLYEKSGDALNTSTSTDVQWSPSAESDWREEVVDLTPVSGHDDIFILIVGIKGSDEGRTIHIDDLSFGSDFLRGLSVSETQLNLPFTLGSTQLTVSSNIPWIIEEDIAWVTPNQTSGTASVAVDFSYEANGGTAERMGVITFKSSDVGTLITHRVEVTQAGLPSVLGVPSASSQEVILYPNPVEDGVVSLDVSPLLYSSARVRIIDFSGAVAWEDTFSRLDARFLRFRPNIARGQSYILHIESGDYSQKLRLLY